MLRKFDDQAIQALGSYVYALLDPKTELPFYIGVGVGNRVFDHVNDNALERSSNKLTRIDEIGPDRVKHVILRHGLTQKEALLVEAVLLDLFKHSKGLESLALGNAVLGHGSGLYGYRTSEEITTMYSSEPLMSVPNDYLLININRRFDRKHGMNEIYEATKEIWKMSFRRAQTFNYVLSEYQGYIRGMFKVDHWYQKERRSSSGKVYLGVGFNGSQAEPEVMNQYINRQIVGLKPRGYSSPLVYPELFNKWRNQ